MFGLSLCYLFSFFLVKLSGLFLCIEVILISFSRDIQLASRDANNLAAAGVALMTVCLIGDAGTTEGYNRHGAVPNRP